MLTMLMNRVETALINSPPRRWLQRFYETPMLLRLGGRLPPGARALEIGCGPGYGTHLILRKFGATQVDALDLDPAMITRARRRLYPVRDQVRLTIGSATDLRAALGAEDRSYDAVFDFGIIHHIPNWRDAITEVARVLRPGANFYYEEVTAKALARPTYQHLFDHPEHDRFTADDFTHELAAHNLTGPHRTLIAGDYLLGVATRT